MEGINEYILDRSIAELPEDSIREFWDLDYETFARDYGIVRHFPGEVFYRAKSNIFLGRECLHTAVAALNGKIYKVLFRFIFISPSTQEYDAFREDAYDYLADKFGSPTETRRPSEFDKISIWDADFGNVILHIDMLGTSVIYTSSVLRPKSKSLWGRLFGS
jgi:hypothetical protein